MVIGTGFILVGSVPIAAIGREAVSMPTFLTICIASCLIGFMLLSNGWVRYRGTLVEKRSIRRLRIPASWRMESNVKLRQGDLDVLLRGPDGQRYAVEIKSFRGVKLKRGAGGVEELRYKDGRPFSKDPVAQTLRAAEETNALPVLWLPEAPPAKTFQMQCGLIVVQGNGKSLLRAVGARHAWF